MNDLFTLLVILAFIISFLNKIFGQKKPRQTGEPFPGQGQKPRQWIPPWLEPQDLGIPDLDEMETIPTKEIFAPKPVPSSSTIISEPLAPKVSEWEIGGQAKQFEDIPHESSKLQFDLTTRDELKKGIVLAEILGTCKGKKNFIKSGSY